MANQNPIYPQDQFPYAQYGINKSEIDLAIRFRKESILAFEYGVGQECLFQAIDRITKINSFDNHAKVWETLLLLSNGFEHIQKALIEFSLPARLRHNDEWQTNGKPEIEIVKNSPHSHEIVAMNETLEQVNGFSLTNEQKSFLTLIESFQNPNNRFENSEGNPTKPNIETLLKEYAKSINGGQVSDELVLRALHEHIYSIYRQYLAIMPADLEYESVHAIEQPTGGILFKRCVQNDSEIDLAINKAYLEDVQPRDAYRLDHDLEIGAQLLESGLEVIRKADHMLDTPTLWVSALLLSNGLEKLLKATILSDYQYGSTTYHQVKRTFNHNLVKLNDRLIRDLGLPISEKAIKTIEFFSDAMRGDRRYENINLQYDGDDLEDRFNNYVAQDLFDGKMDEIELLDHPDVIAYELQFVLDEIVRYFEEKNVQIAFDVNMGNPRVRTR